MALLHELKAHSDLALELDPEAPDLLEDWVETRFLMAKYQAAEGQAAPPALEGAATFLASRVKEPPTRALAAARMLIYWQLAERSQRLHQDPGPMLLEALRCSEVTSAFNRDYLGEVLNFKARLEAARGQDPRPTLDNNLGRLQPRTTGNAGWPPLETAAEAWFIKAEWETGKSLDASTSLDNLQRMADQALRICPGAPSSNLLKGLAYALEIKRTPSRKALLLPAARACLRTAEQGHVPPGLRSQLEHDLGGRT